ncbi:hypothetical protein [Promicromonospora sp. NPDC060271]|uniref:hypothetical protein n=1 Tax=Promicromonospora sp. NPDC060271 TaxID=3347089 RepID=UPI00366690FE
MTNQTAPPDLRNIVTGFTGFEITAILSATGTEAALRTRSMLHLPALSTDSPAVGVGMSTLIARGKVDTSDDGVRPVDEAAALAGICGTATTWVEAVTVAGDKKSVAVFVSAPNGTVFLEPAPYGLWVVCPVRPGLPVEQAAAGYVRAGFEEAGRGPFGGSIEVSRSSGAVRTAAVKIDAGGVWRLQAGQLDALQPPERIDADPTFGVLVRAVAA